jgi:hypothetical protein
VGSSTKRRKGRKGRKMKKEKELLQQNKGKKGRLGDGKSLELHHHCWHEFKLAKPSSSLASLVGFKASRALREVWDKEFQVSSTEWTSSTPIQTCHMLYFYFFY